MAVAEVVNEEEFYTQLISDLNSGKLSLPTLPEVAIKVRDIVNDPNASAADMADIIVTDASLAAKLIKVANSPLFRGQREIDSVQMAVARLGVSLIRNLVTSLMMKQLFNAKSPKLAKKVRDLWEYNSQIAAISHVLGNTCPTVASDEALLAGLIHNIGALPVLMRADEQPELLEHPGLLDKLVEKLSSPIGKKILEAWHFPQSLIDVAAEYSDFTRNKNPEADMTDVVQVALLQSYMGSDHPIGQINWDSVPALVKLGFTSEIEEIELEGCTEKIEAAQNMLSGL
ncbi:MAG: HDOD domain-containing protein [Gammaproteobacteria bacterium]